MEGLHESGAELKRTAAEKVDDERPFTPKAIGHNPKDRGSYTPEQQGESY